MQSKISALNDLESFWDPTLMAKSIYVSSKAVVVGIVINVEEI